MPSKGGRVFQQEVSEDRQTQIPFEMIKGWRDNGS
jgi:hypothetical protein